MFQDKSCSLIEEEYFGNICFLELCTHLNFNDRLQKKLKNKLISQQCDIFKRKVRKFGQNVLKPIL